MSAEYFPAFESVTLEQVLAERTLAKRRVRLRRAIRRVLKGSAVELSGMDLSTLKGIARLIVHAKKR